MNDGREMEQRAHLRVVEPDEQEDSARARREREAAELIAAGPSAIFEAYANYVGSIALKMLGTPDEVDDVVQEVFVQVLLKLDQLKHPGALRVWLARVTVTQTRRHMKRRRWKRLLPLDQARAAVWSGPSPELSAQASRLYAALDSVKVDDRIAWTLRHVHGGTIPEIARWCEASESTIKRRIARAQKRLDERTHGS